MTSFFVLAATFYGEKHDFNILNNFEKSCYRTEQTSEKLTIIVKNEPVMMMSYLVVCTCQLGQMGWEGQMVR